MARERKEASSTKRLFRNPSGQEHLFEKCLEEEMEAEKNAPVECLGMTRITAFRVASSELGVDDGED